MHLLNMRPEYLQRIKMQRVLFLVTVLVFLIGPSPLWAEDSDCLMPVGIFIVYYGTEDMDKVAEVVTEDFRKGKSELEWATTTNRLLRSIKYERLENEIKGQILTEDKATILIRETIRTVAGKVEHDEVYRLIKREDTWLIDDLDVVNEKIKPQGIEI